MSSNERDVEKFRRRMRRNDYFKFRRYNKIPTSKKDQEDEIRV